MGEPTAAKAAAVPNTGRKVAARWPSVPQTHAMIMYLRSGPTSFRSRAIRRDVGILCLSDSAETDKQTPLSVLWLSDSPESDIQGTVSVRWESDSPESDSQDVVSVCRMTDSGESDMLDAQAEVTSVADVSCWVCGRIPTFSTVCWARNSLAYVPLARMSSVCVPCSATRPCSNTTTWSASAAFAIRCVTMITVLPRLASARMVCKIRVSLSTSTLLVASSKM